ncbi:hypothetical protein [Deinococcus peraridilitoris]|uniref:Lipoprotein n=1 Tax=Deinococcus peraridilitoris (strain DSM 19664 / LMG 22246 / CIP 109416 / KR-200) TaxID=937777 RepID=L0A3B7_DEIPD|nr:hypothetical protein [Deinococcus peraridilitoris]AFZ68341.1 hypothetical protein Deipe_2880 [Deinococcus peraridilitoris DSM 19664]
MRVPALRMLALPLLLSSCAFLPPAPGENGTFMFGTRVLYILKDRREFGFCSAELVGCTVPLGSICVVQLDQEFFEKATRWQRVNLVAHELGHCLDLRKLGLSHGGFTDQGKRWGAYYRAPSEGFAEAYARAYIARCGLDLDSLGWMNAQGSCTPPHPREVTPELIETQKL